MALNLTVPATIEIVDDQLPSGRANRMNITVWLAEDQPPEAQHGAARALAISFLERTLEGLRRPNASA